MQVGEVRRIGIFVGIEGGETAVAAAIIMFFGRVLNFFPGLFMRLVTVSNRTDKRLLFILGSVRNT